MSIKETLMLRNVELFLGLFLVGILGARLFIPQACVNLALISELMSFEDAPAEGVRTSDSLSKCFNLFKASDHTEAYLPVRIEAKPESGSGWVNKLSNYVVMHPQDMMAKKELAETLLAVGENVQAFQVYKTIASGSDLYALGQREMQNEHLAQAQTYFSFAVMMEPTQTEWWFQLGEAQYHLGDPAALESYLQVINLPSPIEMKALAHVRIGSLLASQRDYDAAEEHYRMALTLDPRSWSAMIEMGRIYLNKGNIVEACHWYFLAQNENQENLWVKNLLNDIEKDSKCNP